MTPQQLAAYKEVLRLLQQAMVSKEDAAVAADAIVKRIPVLSYDQKFKNAVAGAVKNPAVHAYLKGNSLPDSAAIIFVT